MSNTISIKGLDPAVVLAALYNATRPLGLGILHDLPGGMTTKQAEEILNARPGMLTTGGIRFDYVAGRPLKFQMTETEILDSWGYDRDAGEGTCQRVVDALMEAVTAPKEVES